jgi:hypothetical protein
MLYYKRSQTKTDFKEEFKMGWTGTWNDYNTVDEFFEHEFENEHYRFIGKGALVHLSEYYRCMEEIATGQRFALICKVNLKPTDGCNIFYKDMTESSHPFYYNCPARIMKEVDKTPSKTEEGQKWRDMVHKVLANKTKAKKVKAGTIVKFVNPIRGEYHTFVAWKYRPRTMAFREINNKFDTLIQNWQGRDFEIIGEYKK